MAKEQDENKSINQFVTFTLGDEEYGISIIRVQEIIRYQPPTRVPQTSECLEGVLNLRGRVIPVVNLRHRFGLCENEHDRATRIVVVEVDQQVIGLVVDSVREVRNIEKERIDPPPPMGTAIDSKFIHGMGKLEDQLVILLVIDEIFDPNERMHMAEIAA